MVNVPINRNVKSQKDVQNVITSVILRQKGMFSDKDVLEEVEAKLKFSAFGKYEKERKRVDVEGMVNTTIDALWRIMGLYFDREQAKYKLTIGFPAIYV